MGYGMGGGLHKMELGGTGIWGRNRKWGVESESEAGKGSKMKWIWEGGRGLHGNGGGGNRKVGTEAEVGGRK